MEMVVGAAAIIVVAVLIVVAKGYHDWTMEIGRRAADKSERLYQKMADQKAAQAAEEAQRARQLREQAKRLDGDASEARPLSTPRLTTDRAIDQNPSALVDRYPEYRAWIKRGEADLDLPLEMAVTGGTLAPSDTRYIADFSRRIQDLPGY